MGGRARAWEAEADLRVWPRFSTLERWQGNGSVPGVGGCRADLWAHSEWRAGFRAATVISSLCQEGAALSWGSLDVGADTRLPGG